MEYDFFNALFISINLCATFIIMLVACLCCRKKTPKNEFLGLEGMVKTKNPEESASNTDTLVQIDNNTSAGGDTDSKRASSAPNRSLPDIPVVEPTNDNVSDLYATVGDKVQEKPQGKITPQNVKKQTSVSQHSSMSQADDISSPYARVKTPPHAYDKVRSKEHPYAQLNNSGPSTSNQAANIENASNNSTSRGSNQSLLGALENQFQEIPAASAIAGMVSASQELPYMTPPIVQQPHFSGDSQDSSKGYTSISVREPLANILAQTIHPPLRSGRKQIGDSHYATVSDDSDEMYAAIDDPNNVGDTYTSGSETYAQIQPSSAFTVSVEINASASRNQEQQEINKRENASLKKTADSPIPPPVDTLKAQMHSRQASSSSNTSSVGNLGSPKPEKRQANSPLPPTPKSLQYLSNSNLTSSGSIPSGRNSVASVIECQMPTIAGNRYMSKENVTTDADIDANRKKNFSPSKDIEGMYAKVMKKNKLSNAPSLNASPTLSRKLSSVNNFSEVVQSELTIKEFVLNAMQISPGKSSVKPAIGIDNYEAVDKRRPRSNSYNNKDHGYETIPGDKGITDNISLTPNRKSDGYAQIVQKEHSRSILDGPITTENDVAIKHVRYYIKQSEGSKQLPELGYESLPDQSMKANDPGYELLNDGEHTEFKKTISDYDPNYETLRPTKYTSNDDAYAKVWGKILLLKDYTNDGYSRVKINDDLNAGYSSIEGKKFPNLDTGNHDYASIIEANMLLTYKEKLVCNNNNNNEATYSDIYSSIPNEQMASYLEIQTDLEYHNYQTIGESRTGDSEPYILPASANSIVSTCSNISDKIIVSPSEQTSSDTQMKCSSTSNTISSGEQHSSNYESLTGSESDPNYESVRYLDSENPYERLHNDANINPATLHGTSLSAIVTKILPQSNNSGPKSITSLRNSENGEVDDYFQV